MAQKIIHLKTIVFLPILIFGCNQIDKKESDQQKYFEIEVLENEIDVSTPYSGYTKSIEYIQLDTSRNVPLIGSIDKIKIFNKKIFILDKYLKKRLFVFSENGKFLNVVGEVGQGPGQYVELYDFDVEVNSSGSEIITMKSNNKIIKYGINGRYIDDDKTPLSRTFIKKDNFIAFNAIEYSLQVENFSDKKILKYFPIRGMHEKVLSDPFDVVDDDEVLFRRSYVDTIYKVRQNSVFPHAVIRFSKGLSSDDIQEIVNAGQSRNPSKMGDVKHYLENEDFIYFTFHFKEKLYVTLYDKKENRTKTFPYDIDNDVTHEKLVPLIIGKDGNAFVGYLDPNNVNLSSMDASNIFIKKLLDNFKGFDLVNRAYNPALIFIEFKKVNDI